LTEEGQDLIWNKVQDEIIQRDSQEGVQPDVQQKHLHSHVESKLKVGPKVDDYFCICLSVLIC